MRLLRTILIALLLPAFCTAAENSRTETPSSTEVLVKGRLIDIRAVGKKSTFFPQYDDSVFDDYLISRLGEGTCYAVSLAEYRGPEQICRGKAENCRIALDADVKLEKPWTSTGETFDIVGIRYYVYENRKAKAGEWVDIPYPEECSHSAIVFGTNLRVVGTREFGTVIAKVPELRKSSAYNETFTILPDGSYLAACTGTGRDSGITMYISRDKGVSWNRHGNFSSKKNLVTNYCNLFVHRGSVYIMGVGPDRKGLRICRSDDGGMTWTKAVSASTGIILEGTYHTAPVPMAICDGRIWRACETYPDKNPFMISAPEDSDLLDAANWTRTNTVGRASTLVDGCKMSGSIIEGNAVVAPDGKVVNLIRTNSPRTSAYATILHTEGTDSLFFNPDTDWVRMPGGGKKFTVRFDETSMMYWSLTNPDYNGEANHIGLGYNTGISHSLMRNRLVLICSSDLVNWFEVKTVLYDPDPFFHGFQYVDWMFDGDDIVGVVRVGAPEERGLPQRQHDSNMMTFIRIKDFRNIMED